MICPIYLTLDCYNRSIHKKPANENQTLNRRKSKEIFKNQKVFIKISLDLAQKSRPSGVVSLKRGNSFLVPQKHSDYENPNACGRI